MALRLSGRLSAPHLDDSTLQWAASVLRGYRAVKSLLEKRISPLFLALNCL
jgi:hypothetical protein